MTSTDPGLDTVLEDFLTLAARIAGRGIATLSSEAQARVAAMVEGGEAVAHLDVLLSTRGMPTVALLLVNNERAVELCKLRFEGGRARLDS